MKLLDLREQCRARGLDEKGLKRDLVDRLARATAPIRSTSAHPQTATKTKSVKKQSLLGDFFKARGKAGRPREKKEILTVS
jgi:hypothetical protein